MQAQESPAPLKRQSRSQRQQRANRRLHEELETVEDFTIDVLAVLDTVARELGPARARAVLGVIAKRRRDLGFPEPQ